MVSEEESPPKSPEGGIFCDENVWVIADIRLYNHEKLRQSFDFFSPEEAFAKAYPKWGPACAGHINGDFAAVVVDKKKRKFVCFATI